MLRGILPRSFPCLLCLIVLGLAVILAPREALAQPATDVVHSPRGLIMLDFGSADLITKDGEAILIAKVDGERDMVAVEDGVFIAAANIGFYAYADAPAADEPAADEPAADEPGGGPKPLWQADVRDAAVAADGRRLMALGASADSAAVLVRVLRGDDGSWRTDRTDIPAGAEVLRLERANDLWVAMLLRAAPALEGEPIQPRLEIWSSADGLDWTRSRIPARAARAEADRMPLEYQVTGGNGVFIAAAPRILLRASVADARDGELRWSELPPVLGGGRLIFDARFADGQFTVVSTQEAQATSADGRVWQTRKVKPDVSLTPSGSVVVDGALRWMVYDEGGSIVLRSTDEVFDAAGAAPAVFEPTRVAEIAFMAPAPEGFVAAADDHLWWQPADGAPRRGPFVGTARSIASNAQGVAVASDRVRFVPFQDFGKTAVASPLLHGVVAADDARFLAVGVDSESADGGIVGEFLGADGAWSRVPTKLGDDITPLAMRSVSGGWLMLVRREVPVAAGDGTGDGGWNRPMLEILGSADGSDWRTIGQPLPDERPTQGPVRYALAVGPVAGADGLRMLVAVENRVSTRIGAGAWTTKTLSPVNTAAFSRGLFAEIDRDGVMYWSRGRGATMRSVSGARWLPASVRQTAQEQGVPDEVAALYAAKDGVRGMLARSGPVRPVRELLDTLSVDRPARMETAEVAIDWSSVSRVVSTGDKLVCATRNGLLGSTDGKSFRSIARFPADAGVTQRSLGIDVLDDAVLVWIWGANSLAESKAIVVGHEPGSTPRVIPLPIVSRSAAAEGNTAVFIGSAEPTSDSPAVVAWTDDLGRSWRQTAFPTDMRPTDVGIVRSALGWTTLCRNADGGLLLASSTDLVAWRFEWLPKAGLIHPFSIGVVGEKILVHGQAKDLCIPAVAQLLVTTDGTEWSAFALPSAPFSPELDLYNAQFFASEGRAMLLYGSATLVSDDLEHWRMIDLRRAANSYSTPSIVGDVAFCASGELSGRAPVKIERAPVPTAEEAESLPFLVLEPIKPRRSTGPERFAIDMAAWDAKMSPEVKLDDRAFASSMLLGKWRELHPDAPESDGAALTAAVVGRFMSLELSEESLVHALRIAQSVKIGGTRGSLPSIREQFAKLDAEEIGDLLEDVRVAREGGARKFRINEPVRGKWSPQQAPPEFDLSARRVLASAGDGGAAYDLSYAYSVGLGVLKDEAASQFWMLRARQLGFFDQHQGNPFGEFLDNLEKGRSIMFLLERVQGYQKPDAPEPTVQSMRADLRSAIEIGSWAAMTQLALDIQSDGGSREERAEARELLVRAASRGYGPALSQLEMNALRGEGVLPDGKLAAAYRRLAAERGNPYAKLRLAGALAEGACEERNEAEARRLVEEVAAREPADADFYRRMLAERRLLPGMTLMPVRAVPSGPTVELEARLREARAGNAAACWDVSMAYRYGMGVWPNATVSDWWERKAVSLGWDPLASTAEMTSRGSISVFDEVDYFSLPPGEESRAFLREGSLANNLNITAMYGADLMNGVHGPADLAAGLKLVESAANRGSSYAWSILAEHAVERGYDEASVARAIECYTNAARAGDSIGFLGAAELLLFKPSPSAAEVLRAHRLLLEYAGLDEPKGIDPARDPDAFTQGAARQIAAWAEIGAPSAMSSHGLLLAARAQGASPATRNPGGLEWVLAGDLAARQPVFPQRFYARFADPDGPTILRAARIAWECSLRRDQRDCLPVLAARAANSAPERSTVARALRALLDGTLDERLAREAAASDEFFSIPSLEALRQVAAELPHARGLVLVGYLFSTLDPEQESPFEELLQQAAAGLEPVKGVTGSDMARFAAALHYYGIGVPVSRASATAILIGVRRDLDRFTHLGFSAQGVPNEDAEAMRGALERWFPQWRQ
jgi:TPR repeat protein